VSAGGAARAGAPVLTVFRSRLRPDAADEYHDTARRLEDLARAVPGFLEIKTFVAEDGERVSLVTFATEEAHRTWRDHPAHRAAQDRGRQAFYASYDIAVCDVVHTHRFTRKH
jgi:heme-degrading monooxygenase HmoA